MIRQLTDPWTPGAEARWRASSSSRLPTTNAEPEPSFHASRTRVFCTADACLAANLPVA